MLTFEVCSGVVAATQCAIGNDGIVIIPAVALRSDLEHQEETESHRDQNKALRCHNVLIVDRRVGYFLFCLCLVPPLFMAMDVSLQNLLFTSVTLGQRLVPWYGNVHYKMHMCKTRRKENAPRVSITCSNLSMSNINGTYVQGLFFRYIMVQFLSA